MAGHCVLDLADLELLYQGTDESKAAAAAVEGSHWAEGRVRSANRRGLDCSREAVG